MLMYIFVVFSIDERVNTSIVAITYTTCPITHMSRVTCDNTPIYHVIDSLSQGHYVYILTSCTHTPTYTGKTTVYDYHAVLNQYR